MSEEQSFWSGVWSCLKAIGRVVQRYVLAPGVALVVVAAAVLLVVLGVKNLQIGGVLGRLFGRKEEGKKTVEVANTIPEGRVDSEGKIIPPGTPDKEGMTQAVVVPIEKPGLFDDPSQVKVTPPGEEKPIKVTLPTGVKANDVESVVVVKPEVVAVTVKNDSKVSGQDVDDLLSKYGDI